jgi:phage replication-related protein YjqB (UPF0714/DUF867 family)
MADKFPSVAALMERLGSQAYRIVYLDRRGRKTGGRSMRIPAAQITIIAPHGGFIEAGTSAIAAAVAGKGFNLFDFQGLQKERPEELHVTSTRFRHPVLSELLENSATAISIHGMGDQGHKTIWLGGLNRQLKEFALQNLRLAGFSVNPNSPRYRGVNPLNVVNTARGLGIQLELPNELLGDFFVGARFHPARPVRTTDRFTALVRSLQTSIGGWCNKKRPD